MVVTRKFFGVGILSLSLLTAPLAHAGEAATKTEEATVASEAVVAAEQDLAETTPGPLYFEATMEGVRRYAGYLRANDMQKYDSLRPALDTLQRKENAAIGGSAIFAFTGTFLAMSSLSFLRTKKTDANGVVRREANATVAGIGIGFVAAAFLFYELVSPSRADLLEFVNSHNVVQPQTPLHYESGVLRSGSSTSGGLTIDF